MKFTHPSGGSLMVEGLGSDLELELLHRLDKLGFTKVEAEEESVVEDKPARKKRTVKK